MAGRHSKSKSVDLVKIRGVKMMASLLGLTVLGGGMAVSAIHAHTKLSPTDVVSRPAVYQAASRSMAREDLLKESASTDVTGSWSIGVTTDEVKRNLDAQTKSNDSAAAAKDTLRKALDEAKKLDVSGMTSDSVASLDKARDKASKTLEGKTLRKASEYDSVRAGLKKAVDGLVEKPVLVVRQVKPNGEGVQSSGSNGGENVTVDLGQTVPANEMQKWFHDYLLSNGYTEADFTAGSYIINRESSWNPHATNPSSGAYGLVQALPGSKMASHGADWQTNYQTQLKWFIDYCKDRYGGIQQAYNFWVQNHWY